MLDNEVTQPAGVVELVDRDGKVLAAKPVELDLTSLIRDYAETPEILEAIIHKFIEDQNYSVTAIVMAVNADDRKWHVFEGLCNPKNHTFKVIMPITTFDINQRDPGRPPTAALNFVASASIARGLSVWLP